MKKVLLIALLVVLLVMLPKGILTQDEVCTDCGQVRRAEYVWAIHKNWDWDFRGSGLKDTAVSRFIRRIGAHAQVHVWRPSKTPYRAGRLLSQEEVLSGFDKGIAWDAVRARLRNPCWDDRDPTWYVGQGWPPSDLQETKAWWAGVAERGGSFSH